ncbi:hypothetical protein D3C71_1902530 [compost metagenome]
MFFGDMENPEPRGSEPAREGGVSGNINAGYAGLIASKLAPTGYIDSRRFTPIHDFFYK